MLRTALLLGMVSQASATNVAGTPPRVPGAASDAGGTVSNSAPRAPRELPTGVPVPIVSRPASAGPAYCSPNRPVCVHEAGGPAGEALEALSLLEEAYERLVFGLGLPAPRPDGGLGGSDAIDAYLVDPDRAFSVEADPPERGMFARASGSCRLPRGETELVRRAAVMCLGETLALGLDPSETPHLRRAFATFLWWVVGAPTSLDVEAVDFVQRHPELPIAARELGKTSEGSAIFFEYLEQALGVAGPAALGASLFSAAASPYPTGADYDNEPDLFDVLRHTLDSSRFRFARLMSDFAVARALLGDRDDGTHLPRLAWVGALGRARYDWTIPFSTLPRRVAAKPPIDSTGAVILRLDIDALPERASLGFQAEWEAPVTFDWQLVRLGARGEELGRIPVTFEERGTLVEASIGHLGGVSAVLAVGTNLETVDLSHPFDPDVAPTEPHGVTVYFAKL